MQPNGQWQGLNDNDSLAREAKPTVILPMSQAAPTSFENALNNIPQLPEEKAAYQAAQTVIDRPLAASVQPPAPTAPPVSIGPAIATSPPTNAPTVSSQEQATDVPTVNISAPSSIGVATVDPVYWEGVEYIQRDKDKRWFLIFASTVTVFFGMGVWQAFSDIFSGVLSIILVLSMAATVVVMAKKPPRSIRYTLSKEGLYVNEDLHRLEDFRSFGIMTEGGEYSIVLIPVKRFGVALTVYFPKDSGETIVDMLGQRLPMQPLELDMFERIIRKIRL